MTVFKNSQCTKLPSAWVNFLLDSKKLKRVRQSLFFFFFALWDYNGLWDMIGYNSKAGEMRRI